MKAFLLILTALFAVCGVTAGAIGNELMLTKSDKWTLEEAKPKLILYGEYEKAELAEDKLAIKSLIRMQFAEFDESDIKSLKLKQFLVEMRGY